jgi:hypothetical protein
LGDGRRSAAAAIETPLAKVIDPEVARSLRRGLFSYEGFLKAPWLDGVEEARVPRLTDFLSIRFADRPTCLALVKELIHRVSSTAFAGIRLKLTVGLCVVDPECFLTDREILARANEAKDAAKKGAKGAVGVCSSPHYGAIEILA